jgi:hypothetical protein
VPIADTSPYKLIKLGGPVEILPSTPWLRARYPELSIFQVRDHGALLAIAGKAHNALQYDIGNPVTASLMTRYQLSAALYAPIRVVLYENDAGRGVFEYDQPSTTFGQFGDERVTAVARGLDAALARALLGAAE